jgi:hypothetical protein
MDPRRSADYVRLAASLAGMHCNEAGTTCVGMPMGGTSIVYLSAK